MITRLMLPVLFLAGMLLAQVTGSLQATVLPGVPQLLPPPVYAIPHSNQQLRQERQAARFDRWALRHSEAQIIALRHYVEAECKQPVFHRAHADVCRLLHG